MKKTIILSMLIIGILISCNKNINVGTVISSNGLVLRTCPKVSSNKITVLPFGTLITILDKNGPKDRIDNTEANWFKIKYNDKTGWAYGQFIWDGDHRETVQLKIDTERDVHKKYKLLDVNDLQFDKIPDRINDSKIESIFLSEACFSEICRSTESITLKNGIAHYVNDSYCGYSSTKIEETGSYAIQENKLIITLNPGTETIEAEVQENKKVNKTKGQKLILFYSNKINGLIEEKDLNLLKNIKFIHNSKEHYFATNNDEINYQLCKKECVFATEYNIIGYYHFI